MKKIPFIGWALTTAVLLVQPITAFAHSFPHHSEPRAGSTVTAPPAQVRIWFDSDLEAAFSTITVEDANRKRVDKGDSRIDPSDPRLLLVTCPNLTPGPYRVIWSVVGRDGHHTKGDYTFTLK